MANTMENMENTASMDMKIKQRKAWKRNEKGIIAIMVILCLGLMGFVGFMKFSEDNTPPEIQFQDNEIVYTAGAAMTDFWTE